MKLSIITVSFNAEKVIRNTIESVLRQSEPVYEYIFIDGASKDGTVAIIEEYKEAFEKHGIRYIIQSEPDKGISDAFNKGIRMATGDLIGIINADDELNTDCVHTLREYVEKIDADIYYGDCIWRDSFGDRYKKPKHELKKLLYYMILYHPSTFVKKSCYDECGMFDISYKYCMDKHFLYRCYLKKKRFHYIDKPLVIFKAGGVSDTHAHQVFKEGSRMAVEFGEPKLKVKIIEIKKRIRNILVCIIRKTVLYTWIIKRRKIYN